MKKKIIIMIVCIAIGLNLFATTQVPDVIIYNGNKYRLIVAFPMEYYFIEFPEKRPSAPTSGLWRGYIATFEIIENELWVIDIQVQNPGFLIINGTVRFGYTSIINDCLDGLDRKKMDQFSGYLVIPKGEVIDAEQVSWDAAFENYLVIEVQNGNIINEYINNFTEYSIFFDETLSERYWELFKIWNNINFPNDNILNKYIHSFKEYSVILEQFQKENND